MLKEAIEKIRELTEQSMRPVIICPDLEPDHIYLIAQPGQPPQRVEAEPEPRDHAAQDLGTVLQFADEGSRVWYSRNGVVVLLDDLERRDRVTLRLRLSEQLACLLVLESTPRQFSQQELILALRTTFRDCLSAHPNLVDNLRHLRWKAGQQSDVTIKHGERSVGKQLESQVLGTDKLPEYLRLVVPVFANCFESVYASIDLALEPDTATEKFRLIPIPGLIEAQLRRAETRLGVLVVEALGEQASLVPVSYGSP